MPHVPVFLPPSLPSELLSYIVTHCAHPTTIIVFQPKADFLAALLDDALQGLKDTHAATLNEQDADDGGGDDDPNPIPPVTTESPGTRRATPGPGQQSSAVRLLSAPPPLYQVATARHIRIVFVPTVTHLRAFLAVFNPADSTVVQAPPPSANVSSLTTTSPSKQRRRARKPPLLLVYGFLALHRDTSEWSAQGLGGSAAALVEAAARFGFRAAVVEPRRRGSVAAEAGAETGGTESVDAVSLGSLLREEMPILHGSARRLGPEGVWSGRTVTVRRVLGRWFRFARGGRKTCR